MVQESNIQLSIARGYQLLTEKSIMMNFFIVKAIQLLNTLWKTWKILSFKVGFENKRFKIDLSLFSLISVIKIPLVYKRSTISNFENPI